MSLVSTLYLFLSVSGCLCLCICLLVSFCLGQCHHQMISFQKINGLHGLEHHTVEINGDVTLGHTRTHGHVNIVLEFCEMLRDFAIKHSNNCERCLDGSINKSLKNISLIGKYSQILKIENISLPVIFSNLGIFP